MTAPITPDERAAIRARHTASRGAVQRGVASLTDVPRLLDALDTAEAERDEARAAIARRRALWEHERAKWSDALAFDRRDRDEARAEVARLRAAHDRETAARARDEGHTAGHVDATDDRDPETRNPYREEGT